jgi:hypothetical protein
MASHKTSAKGPKEAPRRAQCVCPICGGKFSMNHSEYKRYREKGTDPTDSRVCGREYLRRTRAGIIKPREIIGVIHV